MRCDRGENHPRRSHTTLLDVLEHEPEYLHRYHCAAALLRLLGSSQWKLVQLANDRSEQSAHLVALCAEIKRQLKG